MRQRILLYFLIIVFFIIGSKAMPLDSEFKEYKFSRSIHNVQPMSGLVLWEENSEYNSTDAIQLEFFYMGMDAVVNKEGKYDWKVVEDKLDRIASRSHQAIFRFYYVYPGFQTRVPGYIKKRSDYHETEGIVEEMQTFFPDWSNLELQRFTLEFYSNFAARYDHDPRIAFLQIGFGLWGEYHIYEGPFTLGKTFPSKKFQEEFFKYISAQFTDLYWNISIDSADPTYSPFQDKPSLLDTPFGLFDDSFLHKEHSLYNKDCFDFFGDTRRLKYPIGGELSYYTDYDQIHALDESGPYGIKFESLASNYNLSYIIANDQPLYQSMERIRSAGMALGYNFQIVSFFSSQQQSEVKVKNNGIAPIFYDAYIAINGVRSTNSLKNLLPGQTMNCLINAGGKRPKLSIECDRLVQGQRIEYETLFKRKVQLEVVPGEL